MLQQTRVATVIPYFHRWMERFPTAEHLAEGEPEAVLRTWEGLGYYSRARNLQRAAQEIVASHAGRVPRDPEALQRLPGVGPYTAGAVASIAFDVPVPAVDGNVRRVLSRLADLPRPSVAAQQRWAASLVDPQSPGDFNQALMELGAILCTPRSPACDACPVQSFCAAHRAGTQEDRPLRAAARRIPSLREAVVALVREDAESRWLLLRRRPEEGLLAGMWEFPGVTVPDGGDPEEAARQLTDRLICRLCQSGPTPGRAAVTRLDDLVHMFTHRRVQYIPFLIRLGKGPPPRLANSSLKWVKRGTEGSLPLPVAQRTLWARIDAG